MTDTIIDRLHRCLVEAIHAKRPDAADDTLTVAEIYKDLVPYRAVRSALGVGLNADYEDAMMRLLAGEGNRVRLEPPEAQDELRQELGLPDPDVGLFRKFAACDARVRPHPDGAAGERADDGGLATRAASEPERPRPEESTPGDGRTAAAASGGGECAFCEADLPKGRPVRYCPFCGASQRRMPCPECGETLHEDWKYCVACGADAAAAGGPA